MKSPSMAFLATAVSAALIGACGAPTPQDSAASPGKVELPDEAITLNVVDVAGNLQLSQEIFDNYQEQHPNRAADITFSKVTAPELVGKVKAQQDAGRLEIDLVLTGTDGLAAGLERDVWMDLSPHSDKLPPLDDLYVKGADKLQALAEGKGVTMVYYPGGPLLEYNPDEVATPPRTPAELLEWARQNRDKFFYPRPANSGTGRAFLMGLPYLLGDSDPKDPVNGWDKTWAYLEKLDQYIDYYPSGTSQTMQELAQGSRHIIPTTTGWDINPRAIGQVPKRMAVQPFDDLTWIGDGHFMVVPKGLSSDRLAVVLDFMNFALQPEQQAVTYDSGYLYPGPAVKDVTLDMAPDKSQQVIREYGRPEYDQLIESRPQEVPLEAEAMVAAFEKWDRQIGGKKVQK